MDNLEKVISTKVQAGEAPDIYNGGPFAGFVEDELLYPVEEVVSDDVYPTSRTPSSPTPRSTAPPTRCR